MDAKPGTSEEGALIKREWWRKWEADRIPPLYHVIQSYDTAFMKKRDSRLLSYYHLGCFLPYEDSGANLILLDALKGRYEFPEAEDEKL